MKRKRLKPVFRPACADWKVGVTDIHLGSCVMYAWLTL